MSQGAKAQLVTVLDQWKLVDKTCTTGSAELEVSCGDYGRFLLGAPSGTQCSAIASGYNETLSIYARSPVTRQWTGASTPPKTQWIAVVDTAGSHAQSVSSLISSLAGPNFEVRTIRIDDSRLTSKLGAAPTDFHVINALCSILQGNYANQLPWPSVVNMSIGRDKTATDTTAGGNCNGNSVSCQLVKVIAALRAHGVPLTAATGNQRHELTPACNSNVISAGQIELRDLIDFGLTNPAWENPASAPARALFVGNGLCVTPTWAAPAGSSYATATISGLIAKAREINPAFDPYAANLLSPQLLNGAWGLTADNVQVDLDPGPGLGSAALTSLYAGVAGGNRLTCWNGGSASTIDAASAVSYAPRGALPFSTWTATAINPAPAEDPCTPCIGDGPGPPNSNTLSINMTQAIALASTKFIDSVRLRVGTNYYALNLDAAKRGQIRDGTAGTLALPGLYSVTQGQSSISMVFSVLIPTATYPPPGQNPNSGGWCTMNAPSTACYWISIPVVMPH